MEKFTSTYRYMLIVAGELLVIIILFPLIKASSGIMTYALLTIELSLVVGCLRELHRLINSLIGHNSALTGYLNLLLVVWSVMGVLLVFEGYLHLTHQASPEQAIASLTMPDEWKARPVEIEGAAGAEYWHGKLHVYNDAGMRRTTPFPPKKPDQCRIMVVGDSLTYGKGVDAADPYPQRIETGLSSTHRVEVLNLGILGVQSEDILKIIVTYAPQLRPDLILYGVCQNDFLESGEGQGARERREQWAFPLPASWKQFMIQHTLSGEFFERSYDALLMRLGLRADFYSNILQDLYTYQIRFTRDMTVMNLFAVQNGLPPIVAMVLDQAPVFEGRGHQVSRLAERIMRIVGMTVIPTEEYYRTYNGRVMKVSPWEGHPNKEAHQIFADAFVRTLQHHPVLQQYKKEP
ncbi:hypothetical protein GF339_23125 [candidate division KSB3 bacterium]|uniref:SGNH hydrolase-type esterase domain-containing protein n=1 Tax=candidate division KSB3 bacterium TaxID=2044937 RepID=A0A9D5Q940_9BACT|nr:hypothetical protein [candidate division KSB3 bacterium]MBD3327496.1 hypothetical protein [candidate division KSB3 bacterium]